MNFSRYIYLLLVAAPLFTVSAQAKDIGNYESIKPGQSVDEAVKAWGAPANFEKDLSKNQLDTISSSLKGVDNKDSESFLIWKKEENLIYVLGINKNNKVAVKHRILLLMH